MPAGGSHYCGFQRGNYGVRPSGGAGRGDASAEVDVGEGRAEGRANLQYGHGLVQERWGLDTGGECVQRVQFSVCDVRVSSNALLLLVCWVINL